MAHFSHSQTPGMVAPLHLTQALQRWSVALWNSVWPCHCTHPLQDGTQCQRKHGRWGWWQLHFQLENVHQLGLPHWQPRDSRQQVCIHHHQLQGKLNSPLAAPGDTPSTYQQQRFKGKYGYLLSIPPYERGMVLIHGSSSSCDLLPLTSFLQPLKEFVLI